jgi:hypothetical protein
MRSPRSIATWRRREATRVGFPPLAVGVAHSVASFGRQIWPVDGRCTLWNRCLHLSLWARNLRL